MTTKVSVIIPVYNAEEYLGQCLDSILMQTLEDIEVICVDDGSKDDSLQTLQGYSFLDSRLIVLSQEHKGANAARNLALKQASGEYVLFLEATDFFEVNMLEKMVAKAESDNSDVVVAGNYVFDHHLKQVTTTEKIDSHFFNNLVQIPEDLGDKLFSFCEMILFNRLIHRSLLTKNNLEFDESIQSMADQSMANLVLACSNKISLMPEAFVYHRIHFKNKEKTLEEIFVDLMKSFGALYKNLKTLSLDEKFYTAYFFRLKMLLLNSLNVYPNSKKKEALDAVKKYIPSKIQDSLLSASKYEPKISIIIPVFNAENYISECLDSCLNQTLKDIEIICVDDGSMDNSLAILNEYAKKDTRIQVLTQENQGLPITRNRAMEKAIGTYIQFLDADDYLDKEACEYLYFYAKLLALDMLSFSAKEFHYEPREEFDEDYHCLTWLPERFNSVFDWKMLNTSVPYLASSACLTLYRRFFLLKNDIQWINKKIAYEDTPFFIESALRAERMGALKFPFYHRRVHKNAITQQLNSNFTDLIFIIKYTLKKIKKLATKQVFKAYCSLFVQKLWGNYAGLETDEKVKYASQLYDLCLYLTKKYHFLLPDMIQDWCLRNMKKKSKTRKLKLKATFYLLKCLKDQYRLSLFDLKLSPNLGFTLFGIPVFSFEKQDGQIKQITLRILGVKFFELQEFEQ